MIKNTTIYHIVDNFFHILPQNIAIMAGYVPRQERNWAITKGKNQEEKK
jgi:hypothetical protein